MFLNILKLHHKNILLNKNEKLIGTLQRLISAKSSNENNSFVYRENFATRHIGISQNEQDQMLKTLNLKV